MIPTEIILTASGSPFEIWAQIADIIIAIGTVSGLLFSIWFSIKSLKKSDWNSNMSTAPSITVNNTGGHFWLSTTPNGGGVWGEPTEFLDPSDTYITFELHFSILNQGRGVALNIQKPKITCTASSSLKEIDVPVSIGIKNTENMGFKINIIELHSRWLELSKDFVTLDIEIEYHNDQRNVACVSKWSAKIKPFDVEGKRLVIRDRGSKILDPNMEITYKPFNN